MKINLSLLTFLLICFGVNLSLANNQFENIQNDFSLAQDLKVVELSSGLSGKCFDESNDSFTALLIRAHKKSSKNYGPGQSRTDRLYKFAIYEKPILSFQAKKLLLERDWPKLSAKSGLDSATTTYSIKNQAIFNYEVRRNARGIFVQVTALANRKVKINDKVVDASKEQVLLNCQF